MDKFIHNDGEFTLVALPHETHVWLTRGYLENDHPVMDSLQIPVERLQAIIRMLELEQSRLDSEAERRMTFGS